MMDELTVHWRNTAFTNVEEVPGEVPAQHGAATRVTLRTAGGSGGGGAWPQGVRRGADIIGAWGDPNTVLTNMGRHLLTVFLTSTFLAGQAQAGAAAA